MKNLLNDLISSDLLIPVGWTVLDSVWQGLVVAILLWIIFRVVGHNATPNSRYWLGVLGLFSLTIWSVFTFNGHLQLMQVSELTNSGSGNIASHNFSVVSNSSQAPTFSQFYNILKSWIHEIAAIWLFGTIIFSLRILGGLWRTGKIRETAIYSNDHLNATVLKIAKRIGVTHFVQIAESFVVKTPIVMGHFKPLILIPLGMLSGIDPQQLEAIIAHELAHIKRNDFLVNIFQNIVEIIFFYNPFVWWISSQIKIEREKACDDLALSMITDRNLYAEALFAAEEFGSARAQFSLSLGLTGINKSSLLMRIKRIISKDMEGKSKGNFVAVLTLTLLLGVIFWTGYGKGSIPGGSKLNVASFNFAEGIIAPSENGDFITIIPKKWNLKINTPSRLLDTIPKLSPVPDFDFNFESFEAFDFEALHDLDIRIDRDIEIVLKNFNDLAITEFLKIPPLDFDFNFRMDTIIDRNMLRSMEIFESGLEEFREQMEEFEVMNSEMLKRMEEFQMDKEWLKEIEKLNSEEWQDQIREQIEKQMRFLPEMQGDLENMRRILDEEVQHLNEFEKELMEELIKDGYINEGDPLNVGFDEDYMMVNDQKIKDDDFEKYQKIRKKYFPRDKGRFRYNKKE